MADAGGGLARGGDRAGVRGARRVLHAPDGDGRPAGAGPRPVRLQACRGGGNGRLRRHLLRVPLAGPPSRHPPGARVRARPGTHLLLDRLAVTPRTAEDIIEWDLATATVRELNEYLHGLAGHPGNDVIRLPVFRVLNP